MAEFDKQSFSQKYFFSEGHTSSGTCSIYLYCLCKVSVKSLVQVEGTCSIYLYCLCKVSVKSLVQVDFQVYALSKHSSGTS